MNHPRPDIDALLSRLYHPGLKAIDLGLERMEKFLARLGNPEQKLPPVIHVAGTNGKGSLIAYLNAIFSAAGKKAHRYTSPHLVRFNERIAIAGHDIADDELLAMLEEISPLVEKEPVTFFESTTAMAYLAFSRAPADITLLETGMGGRLDATNVLARPRLVGITPIDMDHIEYLGDSLEKIAYEKACILKPGVAAIIGPQAHQALDIIERRANEIGAPLFRFGHEWRVENTGQGMRYESTKWSLGLPYPNLAGAHQIYNAGTAIACAEQLVEFHFTPDQIKRGITHAVWPGRLQRLTRGPLVDMLPPNVELWLDGGHNPHAAGAIADWAKAGAPPVHLVMGMLKNKDVKSFLATLAPHIKSLHAVPIPAEPQSLPAELLQNAANALHIPTHAKQEVISAINNIIQSFKEENARILICGSLYLAGHVLQDNA